jgi:integrase
VSRPLWLQKIGESYEDVGAAFKAACQRALVKDCRFRNLRHTFAMRFIEAGGDVVLLSKILGYSMISRTYNRDRHPSNDTMFAAIENMINFPA